MNELDKSALINNECTIKTKIIVDDGTVLTESDYVLSWDYEDFRYVPNQGFLGQFVERVVNGKLKNVDDSFTLENKVIELQFAVVRNDGTETWYSLGHFIVNNPTDDNVKDNTSFKAVDYTKYFETPYVDKVTYPTTAGALAYSVCKQAKTSLGNFQASLTKDTTINSSKQYFTYDSTKDVYNLVVEPSASNLSKYYEINECFTNHDFVIEANQFVNNETCREVMKAISMLAYSWARIGWDDKCYLDFEVNTEIENDHIITNDDYYDLTTKNDYFGEVNKVIIGMKDVDGENTTLIDSNSNTTENFEITLWDNPLTYNQELREKAIVKANKLFDLKYKPVEMTTVGHPWLIGNELLSVVDMEDNVILTYPFDRTISYSGHIKTKIKSQAMSKTDTKYAYEGRLNNLGKSIKNTQIIVDKANQRIDAVVQTQEDLSDTLIPLATSNGVELKLEKSAGQPLVEFELEGNSEQASYEGKNLFNLGLVNSAYSPTDRGFTLKNRFASAVISVDDLPKIMTPSTTYSIKVISKIIEKPTTIGSNVTYDLALYRPETDTHSTFWRNLNPYEKNSKNVGDVTITYTSFTTPSDLTNLRIYGYSFYGNNDGSTTYKGIGEIEIQEIMLVEGTYNESNFPEFEPYVGGTKSPNPDYPQEITVIEGDLSLKGVGENLYEKVNHKSTNTTVTDKNITFDFSVDQDTFARLEFKKELGKTYTIVFEGSGLKDGESVEFYLESTPQNRNAFKNGKNIWVQKALDEKQSFTIDDWYRTNITSAITLSNIMILEGAYDESNVPEYMPYQETIAEIDLQGNFITKLPNGIEDKLYLNQGHLYLEQNVGKVVLNGTENWNKDTNVDDDVDYFYIGGYGIDQNNIDNIMCDSFVQGSRSKQGYWGTTVFVITINKTTTGIISSDDKEQRINKFKTWLSENNVTVYYELAEPIIHDLGEYSIETLKGNSTIRAISNLEPSNMYCKYIRDIEGLDVFQTKNDMTDYYNMEQTESRISETKGVIELSVETNKKLIDEQGKTITSLDKKVTQKIDDDGVEFKTIKDTLQNGVETLKNTLVTININGIQVATNTSKINSVMQNNKFAIQDSAGNDLIFIGYDEELGASVSRMDNLTVRTYFTAGYHRTEGFTDEETNEPRTGWFYVGGSI